MRGITTTLLSAAIAAQAVFASPIRSRSPYVVKETHNPPREWTRLERAKGDHVVQLQIGLKQGNWDELERQLYEVSDPDHERYGKHLTAEEVNELVQPSNETIDLVREWLHENGISEMGYSSAKDWIIVHLPVEFVERLLDTEYHNYKHEDGHIVARTTHWSLPRHLHSHIDAIQPTTSFFRAAPNKADFIQVPPQVPASYKKPSNESISSVCNVTSVTPECFATLYSTKWYKPKAAGKNKVGFTNYLGEIPIRPDTELFLKKYRPEAVSSAKSFKQYSIDNGPVQDGLLTANQSASDISHEANLDVQAISGISWPTPIDSYSTGGEPPFIPDLSTPTNTNEPYLAWVNWLLEQKNIPQVISTSYGEPEQSVPKSYADRVCKQFAQVGARGTSLLFSSGDRGVGGTNKCFTNDGKNTYQFLADFPAACPFVTTVGATMNFEPEEAVYRPARNDSAGVFHDLYASGSGFSTYWERPKYQDKVVPAYIKSLNGQYDGLYNKAGRGYPDVSAQGLWFAYFWNGTEGVISGTSASAPLTSGIMALVNDALIASGKSPLGFMNPWLYSKGYKGFTDITKGSSHGCNTDGFPTKEGWDPITGFGTPNFPELVKLAGADCDW
ncbi:tripeptidyl-peptidase 1 precursor [Lindgomyces ingoldianus]|uniref:Tripeptidyl-peptidase 1 n=1 Tax=Lindgomyces ingoldianus TaxID=673940 RepID=A0ACB6RDA6_9PLEO|nr:tripeptidyl-peptidase 1 precursor [Lindgomyces ingoldianus]KAF2476738.1 tripeptidyl-peptidase 1 precursor [Lindgomyces ingoldianus]